MPKIVCIYVLLREETLGLQALHDAFVCALPRGRDREGETEREGEGTREDERSRERFARHNLIRSVLPISLARPFTESFDPGCIL